jgi:hypothetical protein
MLMSYYDLIRKFVVKNLRFVRLAFLFTFIIRFFFVIFFFGSFIGYFELSFLARFIHYIIIFFFALVIIFILGEHSYFYFFLLLKKLLFFSIDNKKLRALNELVLFIVGKIMLFFIRVISFNYFIASLLFLIASFFKIELLFELILLTLFFRFLYHFIQTGPNFSTVDQALKFYSKVMIGKYANKSPYQNLLNDPKFKLSLLPAPIISLQFSANIIAFRPFLVLFSTVMLSILRMTKFNDNRKQVFYSGFFYHSCFRKVQSFSLVDDLDFSISYFYVLTFNLFND